MVLHDFLCNEHGLFQKLQPLDGLKDFEECPTCREPSRKSFSNFCQGHGGIRGFKPRWFEHIAPEPIYVESKKQLREECKKHDVLSVYLEDSYNR